MVKKKPYSCEEEWYVECLSYGEGSYHGCWFADEFGECSKDGVEDEEESEGVALCWFFFVKQEQDGKNGDAICCFVEHGGVSKDEVAEVVCFAKKVYAPGECCWWSVEFAVDEVADASKSK